MPLTTNVFTTSIAPPDASNNNDSLYFTDQDRGTGGLSFALWNNGVSQFLIDNASIISRNFMSMVSAMTKSAI